MLYVTFLVESTFSRDESAFSKQRSMGRLHDSDVIVCHTVFTIRYGDLVMPHSQFE